MAKKKRKRRTIHEAISDVLQRNGTSMSAEDIYEEILARGLYTFPAKDPLHVVKSTLRRHCVNLDFPSAKKTKYFSHDDDGRFSRLPQAVTVEPTAFKFRQSGKRSSERIVSIPPENDSTTTEENSQHWEIQWRLLDLGARLGMDVWAPRNDRGRSWNGKLIGDVPHLLDHLPQQFQPAAMGIVEHIDVIWLQQRTLFAAFEVEHTTPIYSGLFRMADLMTLVPNQNIQWYVVSADDRFDKFSRQVTRPVFQIALKQPLHSVCKFLPYSRLLSRLEEARNVIDDLRPSFIDRIAESYDFQDAFSD